MAPMTPVLCCYSCNYVTLYGKRDSADVIKMTNHLNLTQGGYLG